MRLEKKTVITLVSIALALSSCVSVKASKFDTRSAASICRVFTPLTYDSKLDSAETKEQIKRHNLRQQAFCK